MTLITYLVELLSLSKIWSGMMGLSTVFGQDLYKNYLNYLKISSTYMNQYNFFGQNSNLLQPYGYQKFA